MLRFLLTVALSEMTLPRHVNCSTAFKFVPSMLMWGGLYASRTEGWYNTSVFLRLMVRPNFLAASGKRLTMCCRAYSVWARRAQSSASISSVMSFSMVFVRARRRRRLKTLPFVQNNNNNNNKQPPQNNNNNNKNGCRCRLAGPLLLNGALC